jgi:hypothetical protein
MRIPRCSEFAGRYKSPNLRDCAGCPGPLRLSSRSIRVSRRDFGGVKVYLPYPHANPGELFQCSTLVEKSNPAIVRLKVATAAWSQPAFAVRTIGALKARMVGSADLQSSVPRGQTSCLLPSCVSARDPSPNPPAPRPVEANRWFWHVPEPLRSVRPLASAAVVPTR